MLLSGLRAASLGRQCVPPYTAARCAVRLGRINGAVRWASAQRSRRGTAVATLPQAHPRFYLGDINQVSSTFFLRRLPRIPYSRRGEPNIVKASSRWQSSHPSPPASNHGGALPKVTRSTNPSIKSRIENDRMMKKAKVTNSTGESYDSTTFFRFANPELFLDPKKRSTWNIVGAVWVCCFAGLGYKYYEDYYKVERKPSDAHGPVKPDGSWK